MSLLEVNKEKMYRMGLLILLNLGQYAEQFQTLFYDFDCDPKNSTIKSLNLGLKFGGNCSISGYFYIKYPSM